MVETIVVPFPRHNTHPDLPPSADFIEHPIPSNIPLVPPLPNSTSQSLLMRSSTTSKPPTTKANSDSNNRSSSQRDDVSITSETSILDQSPYMMRDLHSYLLGEIKKDIQLNNRQNEEEKKAAVTIKTSSLNVMAIMEQAATYRRDKIRPPFESDNEDESLRSDESD